jgi:hypothetical protein
MSGGEIRKRKEKRGEKKGERGEKKENRGGLEVGKFTMLREPCVLVF